MSTLRSIFGATALALFPLLTGATNTVCGRTTDDLVMRWENDHWNTIGGSKASAIYQSHEGVIATNEGNTEVWKYEASNNRWHKFGDDGGAWYVHSNDAILGLAKNRNSVHLYQNGIWEKVGEEAGRIWGGGGLFFATNKWGGEFWQFQPWDRVWSKIGDGVLDATMAPWGELFRTTWDHVYKYTGFTTYWTEVGSGASNIYSGGTGVYAVNIDQNEVWRLQDAGQQRWEHIGEGGIDFAATDNAFYGLSGWDNKVRRWMGGKNWEEVGGTQGFKQIVACRW